MAETDDPFAQFLPSDNQQPATQEDQFGGPDPFAQYLEPERSTDPFSAFAHNFERGIAPAAAGLAAFGAGAEAGAAAGSIAGPWGALGGGLIGGLATSFMGSTAVATAQDWALKQLPTDWQDMLGMSESQQALEAEQQPVASFLGGMTPYLLTMKPGPMAGSALPANATTFQRILANPATSRIFGGALSGGMELGNELATGNDPNWTNIAIATGFGVVFNEPNRIGRALTESGAAPIRPWIIPRDVPTVAQAGDAKVMGPGITEDVFMGGQSQAIEPMMTAQDAARTEAMMTEAAPTADVSKVARQIEPELFTEYDNLAATRDDIRTRLAKIGSPTDEEIATLSAQRDRIEDALNTHVEGQGETSAEAKRLRAQLSDAQSALDDVIARRDTSAAGEGFESPEAAALREQLMATDYAMRDMAPQVSAAYRRAAEFSGGEFIEPETPPQQATAEPTEAIAEPTLAETAGPTIEEQTNTIAREMAESLVAAGTPRAEADALGLLYGRRYVTRAGRFDGALGTPLELFRREGPRIIGERPATKPPLMPSKETPTVAPPRSEVTAPIGRKMVTETPVPRPEGNRIPASELEALDPRDIGVDAKRFQFKAGGDESGVTERLQGVKEWDPRLAGTVLVWRDEAGKDWVADGHQRIGLAKRLIDEGNPDIKVNAFVLDSATGVTDVQARAIAAVKNIAEGTGSAVDAAKILRAAEEAGIDLPPMPPRSALVRDGRALAELSPEAFGMVVNEVIPPQQAAIIGRLVKDPAQQEEAVRLLAKMQPDNVTQAEMVVRDLLASGTETGTQQSLFGEEAFANSVVLERAKVADEAIKQLRKDRATFKTLVSEAERIEGQGNVLVQSANLARLTTDEKAADLLTQLAYRAGPVSDALTGIARRLKSGELSAAAGAREFLGAVRDAVKAGVDTGADLSRPVAGAGEPGVELFQREKPPLWREGDMLGEFETERGQEGFGQALVPGVKPITDADRIAAEAAKPLQGGAAPAAKGSLFDEGTGKQMTLFQPAYHGSPHIFEKFSSEKIGTGEGAQAFGHGLYFAGRKGVAEYYREALAKGLYVKREGEEPVSFTDAVGKIINSIAKYVDLKKHPEDADLPSTLADDALGTVYGRESAENFRQIATKAYPGREALIDAAITEAQKYQQTKGGRLYHVEIPDEHELLDWDKPLKSQPEAVRAAAMKLMEPAIRENMRNGVSRPMAENLIKDMTGETLYRSLSTKLGGDVAASQALREAGIPGHRFLDQQSRNPQALRTAEQLLKDAQEAADRFPKNKDFAAKAASARAEVERLKAEQSHNYVIYDDSRVGITTYEQRNSKANARGYIRPDERGMYRIITLTKNADASTFVHETGHMWLEELLRDAAHEAAPDVLKNDAQTVRKWLGMKEDQSGPTRRQHEKFARGHEQYMREGIAPSPALARVFAQFKTWLTQIYQSLKGLGAPINDDIKGVFDRLLELEPQRTVIAPEREGAPTIHDIHEADAAEVDPREAEPIGDRISAETAAYVAQQTPEVQNELAAALDESTGTATGGQTGAEPATGAPLGTGGGEPQAQPTGGAGGGERGPVGIGGGEGVQQGAGAGRPAGGTEPGAGLRNERPVAAGAAGAHPLAPGPTDLFGPQASPFTDKAGNIRIENLTTDQDVAQAIRDAAAENNDFIGERRGVITNGQMMDLADALGMDAEQLSKRKLGQAFNAEQVWAARKLLVQSATDVSQIAKKVAAGGTDEDVMAYAKARARHQMIQGHVAGITAEAGRALAAFRNMAGMGTVQDINAMMKASTAKTLFQLREEAAMASLFETPEQVSRFMQDARKRNFSGMILEYWINGLVSGPRTHVTNLIGNMVMSMQVAGPETAAAALIGEVRARMGRQGTRIRPGEVVAGFKGMQRSMPVALKAAIDAVRTGRSVRLPGEEAKPAPYESAGAAAVSAAIDEAARYEDLAPEVFGLMRGTLDAAVAVGKLISTGGDRTAPLVGLRYSPLGQIPDVAVRGTTVLPVGTALRFPTRMLAAGDSFFRAMNYSMNKSAVAYRTAAEEGLTGNAFNERVAKIYQNPAPEVMDQSVARATELTFMARNSEFVKLLNRFAETKLLGFPVVKFVVPFINTPANIIEQTVIHRTPIGILSPELRADIMGKNGNIAQDTAMARMLVGSLYVIGFGALASRGLLSGSGPADDNTKALWRLAGNQPHSVRIGDMWYDVRPLGPVGMLSGIAADAYDVGHAVAEGDVPKVGATLMQAFTQNILDASFMKGPSDLIQALEDPARYGQSYIRSYLSSFVPFSGAMGQVARATDPYSRQARSILDTVKQKVPGLSETLMPRRDIWGNPMPSGTSLGPPVLSAVYTSQVSADPVNHAMLAGGYWPGTLQRKIRGVELTDQQFDEYQVIAGQMAKQRLDVIVRSGLFQQWPAQVKHDVIAETISQSREVARGIMMSRYPQIAAQAVQQKFAALSKE